MTRRGVGGGGGGIAPMVMAKACNKSVKVSSLPRKRTWSSIACWGRPGTIPEAIPKACISVYVGVCKGQHPVRGRRVEDVYVYA